MSPDDREPRVIGTVVSDAFEAIEAAFHAAPRANGLFASLYLGGEQLVAVGALPGVGCSTLLLQLAADFAEQDTERPVLVFTSMTSALTVQRFVSLVAAVSHPRLARGAVRAHDWENISRALTALMEMNIRVDDTLPLSVARMIERVRVMKKGGETIGAIVIDSFAQMMPNPNVPRYRKYEEMQDMSRDLLSLRQEAKCPVIVGTSWPVQTNTWASSLRAGRSRDLYQFGPLASDADVVLLLDEEQEGHDPLVALRILKHRAAGAALLMVRKTEGVFVRDEAEVPS